jgi:hypothetical protein
MCFEPKGDFIIASIIAKIFGNDFVRKSASISNKLITLISDLLSNFLIRILSCLVMISAKNLSITPQPEFFLSISITDKYTSLNRLKS